jgi:membrane protease YdiL (CAAX protease family)
VRNFFVHRDDHVGEWRPLREWDALWKPKWWLDPPDDPKKGDWFWVGAIFVLVTYANIVSNAFLPDFWHIPFNLGVLAIAIAIARRHGTGWTDMGLRRDRIARGLVIGGITMALIAAGIVVVVIIPPTRDLFRDDRIIDATIPFLLFEAFIRVPIATAFYECVLFRGVIFGMLSRRMAPLWAASASSVAFGFWHILPTLETVEANPVGGMFAGVLGMGIASIGAVISTAAAGMVFMWLRFRANSVVAPILAHAAWNGFAILAGLVVVHLL